jgi:hypothetical protein
MINDFLASVRLLQSRLGVEKPNQKEKARLTPCLSNNRQSVLAFSLPKPGLCNLLLLR